MGDLNRTIAAEKYSPEFETLFAGLQCVIRRKTKHPVLTTRGWKILEMCENFGKIILNGRKLVIERGSLF